MDSATTATNTGIKKQSGFKGKRHDIATKNRISQTQKARYNYMRQMMGQHQQNEQSRPHDTIDIDSPRLAEKIRKIVREQLMEEIKKAIPTRQNIPIL